MTRTQSRSRKPPTSEPTKHPPRTPAQFWHPRKLCPPTRTPGLSATRQEPATPARASEASLASQTDDTSRTRHHAQTEPPEHSSSLLNQPASSSVALRATTDAAFVPAKPAGAFRVGVHCVRCSSLPASTDSCLSCPPTSTIHLSFPRPLQAAPRWQSIARTRGTRRQAQVRVADAHESTDRCVPQHHGHGWWRFRR